MPASTGSGGVAIDKPITDNPAGTGESGGGSSGSGGISGIGYAPDAGSGIVIQAYQALGAGVGKRLDLPSGLIGPCNWTIEPNGGYGDFSTTVYLDPETGDFPAIPLGARFDAWRNGVRLFRGYAVDFVTSEEEPAQLQISGYGRIFDLDKLILSGNYQYAHSVDVSQIFADVAADIQARFPDIVVVAEPVGVKTNNVGGYRKSAREVLTSLYDLVSSVATLGFDVEPLTGRDRLYLRKKSATTDHSVSVPGAQTGRRERAVHLSDLVTVVSIEGDEPDYPQFLPNPSLEYSRRLGEGGGNLLQNPSYEDGSGQTNATGWTLANGAVRQQSDTAQAHTGNVQISVDGIGESVSQTQETPTYALVPGHDYTLSFWVRPEPQAATLNPAVVEGRLWWRRADGTFYPAVIVQGAPPAQAYQQYAVTARCPGDATGFMVQFVHVGGSTGGAKGALIDDAALYDNALLVAQYWDTRVFGDAQIKTINWRASDAKHGRCCLFIDATASDTNGHDIAIRCTPSYRFNVIGSQSLRFSFWLKGNVPNLMRQVQFWDKDNSIIGTANKTYIAAATLGDWTYYEVIIDVPNLAVQAEAWFNLRGSGAFWVDCLSMRCAADGETLFLDAGNLFCTFTASDLVSLAEDADVNQSVRRYGLRERIVKVDGIKSVADARTAAKTYLLNNASDVPAPVVDVLDYDKFIWVGDGVRLVGNDATRYSDRVLPLMRIGGSLDGAGLVTHKLEIKRVQETEQELYAAMAKRSATRLLQSQGAQSGSLPTGGIVSGGVDDDA